MPKRLLAEALKALRADGIVESTRGAQGGYRLAKPALRDLLRDVVGALEGNPMLTTCDGPANGEEHSCEMESVCRIKSPLARAHGHLGPPRRRDPREHRLPFDRSGGVRFSGPLAHHCDASPDLAADKSSPLK